MSNDDDIDLVLLVQSLLQVRQTYYDLIQAGIAQKLGPPAAPEEIQALEEALGRELSPSYKRLLKRHNGWTHWEGDIHLLSTAQMLRGEYHDWIMEWKEEARKLDDTVVVDGIVIACELNAATGLILDVNEQDERGEYRIVNWDNGPVSQYWDVPHLLAADLDEWEALLAAERAERGLM